MNPTEPTPGPSADPLQSAIDQASAELTAAGHEVAEVEKLPPIALQSASCEIRDREFVVYRWSHQPEIRIALPAGSDADPAMCLAAVFNSFDLPPLLPKQEPVDVSKIITP